MPQTRKRKFLSFLIALSLLVGGILVTGDVLYPDRIRLRAGDEPRDALCFSLEEPRCEASGGQSESYRLVAFGFLPVKAVTVTYYPETEVELGGELFGVRLQAGGLFVTGFGDVDTGKDRICPGKLAGLKKGDLITAADGIPLTSAADFSKLLAKGEGKTLPLTVTREGESLSLSLTPVKGQDGGYRAGLWVRDGAAGIGTVTFRDPVTGQFAGLGHAVCDAETAAVFPIAKGELVSAVATGIRRGEKGAPGEIRGRLEEKTLGQVLQNTPHGVFGVWKKKEVSRTVSIALKEEVKKGKATILCTLDGEGKKEYEIVIEELSSPNATEKNMILHVTDPRLLEKTGGIVQGMSGSPILQDGKLIGAVTHVLVGDPTRGYGIFIENMLNAVAN